MKDPKQEAKELVDKIFAEINSDYSGYYQVAKAIAIITCDEVIKVLDDISWGESGTTTIDYGQSHYIKMKAEIINNL